MPSQAHHCRCTMGLLAALAHAAAGDKPGACPTSKCVQVLSQAERQKKPSAAACCCAVPSLSGKHSTTWSQDTLQYRFQQQTVQHGKHAAPMRSGDASFSWHGIMLYASSHCTLVHEQDARLNFVLWPNEMTSPGLTGALLPLPIALPLIAVPKRLRSACPGLEYEPEHTGHFKGCRRKNMADL